MTTSSPILVSVSSSKVTRYRRPKKERIKAASAGLKYCPDCGEDLPLSEFGINRSRNDGLQTYCKEHYRARSNASNYRRGKSIPLGRNRGCASFLGVYVAERVLGGYFDNLVRMPYCNVGYDYVCGKGFKIDVKSSCLHKDEIRKSGRWEFGIHRNQMADYFLCLAFDNRESLNPMHVWLFPRHVGGGKHLIAIGNTARSIKKYKAFERPVENVLIACETMRGGQHA